MTGTPSRTARVSTARWNLKEAAGKPLPRGTRSAYEAADRGREGNGTQTRQSSGSIRSTCDGDGGKVTRLTLGTLSVSTGMTVCMGMVGLNGHEAGNGGYFPRQGPVAGDAVLYRKSGHEAGRKIDRTQQKARRAVAPARGLNDGHGPVPGPRQWKETQHGI
jgi:hypothetical protein